MKKKREKKMFKRAKEKGKRTCLDIICDTYLTMMKHATAIPYLKKIHKIYESFDTSLERC